jgi:head-tail adaptor
MRAGRLDEVLTIEVFDALAVNDFGTAAPRWIPLAENIPAERVQASAQEFIRGGAVEEIAYVWRIRWLDGVSNANRVAYEDDVFAIKEIKKLGRRQGLELRCAMIRGGD